MKIGALAISEGIKPSQTVEEVYKKGIHTIELLYNTNLTLEEIKRIKKLDLDISIHCPFKNMQLKYPPWSFIINKPRFYFERYKIKEFEKSFLAAEKLEATHYIMHGGGFPRGYSKFVRLRKKEKFLQALVTDLKPFFIKAKDLRIKVLLENLMPNNIFGEVSDILYIQEKFPWTGFCLDFAHSELTKQTDILKDFCIDHVHISDNDSKNDLHLPIGDGKLDFFKLFNILKNKNYKGKVICEDLNIPNAVKSVAKTESLFKNFLES